MIFLREITKTDIEIINKWRNDQEIVDSLGATFRYVNLETDEIWFENYMKNRTTQIRCAICLKENGKIIGVVYLIKIDQISKNAEFAIMIGDKDQQNKGIGTIATKTMLEYAFQHLNLNRVYLTVLEKNSRAIRMYEKVGFTVEGVMREAIYKDGVYQNQLIMSFLKNEFQ